MSELLNTYKISFGSTKVELTDVEISQNEGVIQVGYNTIPSAGNENYFSEVYVIRKIEFYGSDDPDFQISDNNLLETYHYNDINLDGGFNYAYDTHASPYQYIKILPFDNIGPGKIYSDTIVLTRERQLNVFDLDEPFDNVQNWFSGKFAYEHKRTPATTYTLNYYGDPINRGELGIQVSGHASKQGVVFYLSDVPPAVGYKIHVISDSTIPIYQPMYNSIELSSLDGLMISDNSGGYSSDSLIIEVETDETSAIMLSDSDGNYASQTSANTDIGGDISKEDISNLNSSNTDGDYSSNTTISISQDDENIDITKLESSDESGDYGSDTEIDKG